MMVTAMKAGQRPRREPEGTKSCRIQGESVRTYVRPSTRPSPLRPIRGRPRPLRARCRPLLIGLDQRLRGLHLPLRGLGLPLIGLRGGTCGRTYVRTDGRTDVQIPLYSTGLRPLRIPPGPLPKNKSNRIRTIDTFSCVLLLLLVLMIILLLALLYYLNEQEQ